MRRPETLARGLLILSLALGAASAFAPARAEAGWWDDLDKGERVRLADLVADPRRWKDKVVTFACIHHAPDAVYQPYFTSFTPENFLNFTAWLDGSPLWELDAYQRDDFPFLYLRRDHPQRDELTRLPMFTRIEVTGRVRDVYRERPWIEVLGLRVTPATLGKAVVDWVKAGDGYASAGDVTRAESYYRVALAQVTLEETYALRVRKRLADLLRFAGRATEATEVEGGRPIVGATPTPTPPEGAIPDARPAAEPADAPPPAPVTGESDLPGTPVGLPGARPSGAPPPLPAPPPPITTDLPGTDYGSAPPPLPAPAPRALGPGAAAPVPPATPPSAAPSAGPSAAPPPAPPSPTRRPGPARPVADTPFAPSDRPPPPPAGPAAEALPAPDHIPGASAPSPGPPGEVPSPPAPPPPGASVAAPSAPPPAPVPAPAPKKDEPEPPPPPRTPRMAGAR